MNTRHIEFVTGALPDVSEGGARYY